MGFLGNLVQAAVDVVGVPVAGAIDVMEGGVNRRTAKQISRVGDDLGQAVDDLGEADLL